MKVIDTARRNVAGLEWSFVWQGTRVANWPAPCAALFGGPHRSWRDPAREPHGTVHGITVTSCAVACEPVAELTPKKRYSIDVRIMDNLTCPNSCTSHSDLPPLVVPHSMMLLVSSRPAPRLIVRVAGHLLVDAFALFGGWRDDPVAGLGDQNFNSHQRISGDLTAVRRPHADNSGMDRVVSIRPRPFVHQRSRCKCPPGGCCVPVETLKQVGVEAARLAGPVYRPLLQLQLLECAHRAKRSRAGLPARPA